MFIHAVAVTLTGYQLKDFAKAVSISREVIFKPLNEIKNGKNSQYNLCVAGSSVISFNCADFCFNKKSCFRFRDILTGSICPRYERTVRTSP